MSARLSTDQAGVLALLLASIRTALVVAFARRGTSPEPMSFAATETPEGMLCELSLGASSLWRQTVRLPRATGPEPRQLELPAAAPAPRGEPREEPEPPPSEDLVRLELSEDDLPERTEGDTGRDRSLITYPREGVLLVWHIEGEMPSRHRSDEPVERWVAVAPRDLADDVLEELPGTTGCDTEGGASTALQVGDEVSLVDGALEVLEVTAIRPGAVVCRGRVLPVAGLAIIDGTATWRTPPKPAGRTPKAAKPKRPIPARRRAVPEADELSVLGRKCAVVQHQDGTWSRVQSDPGPGGKTFRTAREWDEGLEAFRGVRLREYDRGGRCTRDTADEAGGA